jgi:carboxyl-terminal processing protease
MQAFRVRSSLLVSSLALALFGKSFAHSQNSPIAYTSGTLIGAVIDPKGQPVSGAKVTLNRMQGAGVDLNEFKRGYNAVTDGDGRFEIALRFEAGKTLRLMEVWADKAGLVRGSAREQPSLSSGGKAEVSIVLDQGEILSGRFQLDAAQARKAEVEGKYWFSLKGPGVSHWSQNARTFFTDTDGKFEIFVPKGEYTVSLVLPGKEWPGIRSGLTNLLFEIPPFTWNERGLGPVFDQFWERLDRQYSYFYLKTNVDWTELKARYRPAALRSKNPRELGEVLQRMLAPLQDLHVWVKVGNETLAPYKSSYQYNGNQKIVLSNLVEQVPCGTFAMVAKTKGDGFGYFLMVNQGAANATDVQKAIAEIQKLRAVPGFIVDLRRANGGSEPLAAEIASQFCSRNVLYAKSKRRNGPGHNQFDAENSRTLNASANPFTKPVVCLIGPGAVSSGEGFVKMMKALPQVTTVGMPTRGASGNPQEHELGDTGVTVYFSTWVDLMPDGATFEGKGIPPEIEVNLPDTDYASADPTLEKGIEILRQRLKP